MAYEMAFHLYTAYWDVYLCIYWLQLDNPGGYIEGKPYRYILRDSIGSDCYTPLLFSRIRRPSCFTNLKKLVVYSTQSGNS